MGLLKYVVLIAFLAWLCVRIVVVLRILLIMGFGTPVFNHAPGPCKLFYVNGSEDIDILPSGLAIISSGLKYSLGPHEPDPAFKSYKGKIYGFDFNDASQVLKEFTLKDFDTTDFVPHGIDTYTDRTTGEITLFVINHGNGKETVEIFHLDEKKLLLQHKKTVEDEQVVFPNDLVAVGHDSFYVTNDHFFENGLLKQVEAFFPLRYGNVVFYNGTNATVVFPSGSMTMPNGINIDNSGKYVFVSDVVEGKVFVFKRIDNNTLEKQQEIEVGAPLDNVFVDEMGHLWGGGASIALIEYSKNFSNPCPAKAYQVKLVKENTGKTPFKVENILEVYSNKGDGDFKGTSSAAFYRGKMLIGTVFGNLMYCDVIAV